MAKKKKQISPIDVKAEDIDKTIDNTFYGIQYSFRKTIGKLFSFFLFFLIYIYIVVNTTYYAIKAMIMIFGLVFLVILFQYYVVPAFKKPKRELSLKS